MELTSSHVNHLTRIETLNGNKITQLGSKKKKKESFSFFGYIVLGVSLK